MGIGGLRAAYIAIDEAAAWFEKMEAEEESEDPNITLGYN